MMQPAGAGAQSQLKKSYVDRPFRFRRLDCVKLWFVIPSTTSTIAVLALRGVRTPHAGLTRGGVGR